MPTRRVKCPMCGAVLDAPSDFDKPIVRCGSCQHRFRMPKAPGEPAPEAGEEAPAGKEPVPAGPEPPPAADAAAAKAPAPPAEGEQAGADEAPRGKQVGQAPKGSLRVRCPQCGAVLDVPPDMQDSVVRCGSCRHRFRMPKVAAAAERQPEPSEPRPPAPQEPAAKGEAAPAEAPAPRVDEEAPPRQRKLNEEAIAAWLVESRDGSTELEAEEEVQEEPRPAPAVTTIEAGGEEIELDPTESVHLIRQDSHGALFLFPAELLRQVDFRCTIPRRCVYCGHKTSLRAHLVIFGQELRDSATQEIAFVRRPIDVTGETAQELSKAELLSRLPQVAGLPEPANLPMPYWLCEACDAVGMIAAQMEVPAEGGPAVARLQIARHRRAEEFLVAAGGADTSSYRRLQQHIKMLEAGPWEMMPPSVQQRLRQWFRPEKDETFLAYVADRNLGRTEDGMVGIVITDQRLIHHSNMRHREAKPEEILEIVLAVHENRGQLGIKAPAWNLKNYQIGRDGIEALRRGLTQGDFQVVWK